MSNRVLSGSSKNTHGDKLRALASNPKLPKSDKKEVSIALKKYSEWIGAMDSLDEQGDKLLASLVKLLNQYKRAIEIMLVYLNYGQNDNFFQHFNIIYL
ncbi:MAG: hypothetical protein HQK50_14955 [Oligoflexia bacterium]|nr:hypothetical protein [Oligoflexia bacterium]